MHRSRPGAGHARGEGAIDGVLFLLAMAAIVVIVWWEIRNDRTPPDGPTTGWLAMPPEPAAYAGPRKRGRP